MSRERKQQTLSASPPAKLCDVREPIHIHRDAIYPEAALTELLHLARTTLETLREEGRLVPRTIGNMIVYVGADVLAYLRAVTVAPDATQDSSAA